MPHPDIQTSLGVTLCCWTLARAKFLYQAVSRRERHLRKSMMLRVLALSVLVAWRAGKLEVTTCTSPTSCRASSQDTTIRSGIHDVAKLGAVRHIRRGLHA
ncbi:hypothetical protein EDB81DRAFT_107760 [Dactylonectria macrodidyma]|uniref:Uncharacterized protein n=1 Tax=Dactylonectria macrodidyma TaxID=307937 RepID=A0A9P9ISH0_9HYPO|nr:hypothetical protein EDB81DRAFT_107760 [Dactylonectria macrodidyma]